MISKNYKKKENKEKQYKIYKLKLLFVSKGKFYILVFFFHLYPFTIVRYISFVYYTVLCE